MSPDQIAVIKTRAAQYANAIGPGGEKAWLAGLLAADVPELLDLADRLGAELVRKTAALAAVEQDRDRLADALRAIRDLAAGATAHPRADLGEVFFAGTADAGDDAGRVGARSRAPAGGGDVKPRLLDLFCCEGGAGEGYAREPDQLDRDSATLLAEGRVHADDWRCPIQGTHPAHMHRYGTDDRRGAIPCDGKPERGQAA